jgi:hypothetical protein
MALTPGTDTWATTTEADAYLLKRVGTADWFLLDEAPATPGADSKETYLTTAYYTLLGHPEVTISPSNTSDAVKNAQIEFALYLVQNYSSHTERDAAQAQGLSEFEFSERKEKFTGSGGVSLPSTVRGLLSGYFTGNTFATLKGQWDA